MIDLASNVITGALISSTIFYGAVDYNHFVEQRECLAMNIYHEARGEPIEGQIAVAQVTVNRANHSYFPDSVCEVVHQARYDGRGNPIRHQCQFSWYCDGRSDRIQDQEAYSVALNIADWVLRGEEDDPTNGAVFYHAEWVNPSWASKVDEETQIGIHIFYTWDGRW